MRLRSGKIYDASFPARAREFMNFRNPKFCEIWDAAAQLHNLYYSDEDPRHAMAAMHMFKTYMMIRVKDEIGYHA